MKNNDSRLFIKNDAVYVTVVFVSVVLFIVLLAFQIFSGVTSTRYFIGAALILLAFLMNIFEGKFGYYISFALNFVQFMIYTYEYIMLQSESAPMLIVMTIINMFIDLLLQYYVIKVAGKIQGIEDAKRIERGKAIRKELEDEMFSRTSLIVNHEVMGSHQGLSEAIGRNLTSSIDPLTTLPGRDMITERADKFIREDIANMQESDRPDSVCRPFTVIYLALDHFDNITRAIGHKSMDLFIQNMAHRLREAADPTDMVARIDDADFVILFKRVLSKEAEIKYADKLAKEASRAFAAGIDSMNASIHYGFAHYPTDSRHAGEIIAKAEERMSIAAKASADNKDISDEQTELPGSEVFKNKTKEEIVAIFERAIDDGNIHMVYQPCFTAERKLTGFEAFLRFDKNDKSIPPQVFLAAAENAGYMRRIGSFSMESSLSALSQINKIDPKLTMNINLSNYQLREPDFIQSFSNIVSSTDCNVNNLILDLQEESLITSLSDIRMTIEELATTGVKMALDNFGRGYSSFNAIPLLPVSVLKLDGIFTSRLATDATVRILTRSAITLMHDIDITVTATGVGQEDQFDILAGSGCDRFQGLFMGPAISSDELSLFIASCSK
ncbi:MAG: bifunctional diguanylate cyclase/phosphodiesterase [Clostridiales bacterium]|nr:bifunctional diguanylate cyclase/phosphodiesterase [Clostridiales bacterium]